MKVRSVIGILISYRPSVSAYCAVDSDEEKENDQNETDNVTQPSPVAAITLTSSSTAASSKNNVNVGTNIKSKSHFPAKRNIRLATKYATEFHNQKMKNLKEEHLLKMCILNKELELKKLEFSEAQKRYAVVNQNNSTDGDGYEYDNNSWMTL